MSNYNEIRKETTRKMHEEGKKQQYLWTKTLMLETIKEVRSDLDCSKLSVKNLRELTLKLCSESHGVQYYEFNSQQVQDLTQDTVDSYVAGNKQRNKDLFLKRTEQGKVYEKIYKELTEKYNLKPKKTEWNQQRLIEFEVKHIKALEEEYQANAVEYTTQEAYVYLYIKQDIYRRRNYNW